MERILLNTSRKQDRPYSQIELKELREKLLSRSRVGRVMVSHEQCGHFYFAKEGGKKEQRIVDSDGKECGSCSVCWQLKKTPVEFRERALELVDEYQLNFESKPTKWNLGLIDLERSFYRWVYYDDTRRKKKDLNNNVLHEDEEEVKVQVKEEVFDKSEFPILQ